MPWAFPDTGRSWLAEGAWSYGSPDSCFSLLSWTASQAREAHRLGTAWVGTLLLPCGPESL